MIFFAEGRKIFQRRNYFSRGPAGRGGEMIFFRGAGQPGRRNDIFFARPASWGGEMIFFSRGADEPYSVCKIFRGPGRLGEPL